MGLGTVLRVLVLASGRTVALRTTRSCFECGGAPVWGWRGLGASTRLTTLGVVTRCLAGVGTGLSMRR